MSGVSRRTFLGGVLAGGALAGASGLLPRSAQATGPLTAMLSTSQTYKILEIYLDGGADLWLHFYQAPWNSHVTWVGPPGLDDINTTASWAPMAAPIGTVHPSWKPSSSTDASPFAVATAVGSIPVHWGAALKPLWKTTIDWNTRMVMVGHDFFPHEGGIPLAHTGTSFGRPIGCSLGAALNRARPAGTPPVSFVIPVRKSGISALTLQSASATGFHGAQNMPVVIGCGDNSIFPAVDRGALVSGSTVSRAAGDPLRNFYNASYRSMLYHGGRSRSRAYDAYEGSLITLDGYAGIQTRIAGASFTTPTTPTVIDNPTLTAITAACTILNNGAKHATVIDTDWDTHTNGAYSDAEGYALYVSKKTLWLSYAIAEMVDSGALDLSTTIVYIHSEFGRYHEPNSGGPPNGTQHGPHGYPVLLMGGPIGLSAPSGIVGDVADPGPDGSPSADGMFGVTGVRAALALAAGINPFHQDMYVESSDWLGGALSSAGTLDLANPAVRGVLENQILGI